MYVQFLSTLFRTASCCSPLCLVVSNTPKGRNYVWDGHHRVCALYLGGRNYLDASEYEILNITYALAMTPNLDTGYVTPFDPRTEVRKRDFLGFKRKILTMRSNKEKTDQELIDIIIAERSIYCKTRTVTTIEDLVKRVHAKAKL
eukprot:TRINITY_DN2524_c0_g1_i2.p1 TRINITY_DN2524_c0_g1~~TRINITY_DN2524_c0_g1_i2.p1  ORF type:complete len:145 (-),score=24.86 TRINITY_DN2524_c0_g1_i2:71-505(-)